MGMPDAYRGETVVAYVVANPGERVTEEEIKNTAANLPPTRPRKIFFIDELPKSASGKSCGAIEGRAAESARSES